MIEFHSWRKSSRSSGTNQGCVEVADAGAFVGVRDSKDRRGPRLEVSAVAWTAFVADVRSGVYVQGDDS